MSPTLRRASALAGRTEVHHLPSRVIEDGLRLPVLGHFSDMERRPVWVRHARQSGSAPTPTGLWVDAL